MYCACNTCNGVTTKFALVTSVSVDVVNETLPVVVSTAVGPPTVAPVVVSTSFTVPSVTAVPPVVSVTAAVNTTDVPASAVLAGTLVSVVVVALVGAVPAANAI